MRKMGTPEAKRRSPDRNVITKSDRLRKKTGSEENRYDQSGLAESLFDIIYPGKIIISMTSRGKETPAFTMKGMTV